MVTALPEAAEHVWFPGLYQVGECAVATDVRILAGKHAGSGLRAGWGLDECVGELDAFLGEGIDVRGLDQL